MKTLRPVLFAFGLLLVVSAAQAQQPVLKANIPFNFVVGNRVLPAGEYELSSMSAAANVIAVHDWDNKAFSAVGTNPCSLNAPSKTSKLVFHRLGGEYFLYQVWIEGRDTGREFPRTKLETQLAKNHTDADEIIIAAVIAH